MAQEPSIAYGLTGPDEAAIRAAASEVLDQGFQSLARLRILPRSRYRPWIWMARDYFGDDVRDNGRLAEMLEAALPARFERQHLHPTDYPWSYSYALLEAAVAAATLTGQPYETHSPAVEGVIDEFIRKLCQAPKSTVLQVVADIGIGGESALGDSIEIAGVRVVRVDNVPERFIELELPAAGYKVERSDVFVHPGPVSLLVATVRSKSDSNTRTGQARTKVSALIASVRLATGSTARAVADIQGDPDRVRWERPAITPLPSWGVRLAHRPAMLSHQEADGLATLASTIDSWTNQEQWTPMRLALGRLARSLDARAPGIDEQVIDLSIGLEAALGGVETTEIGLRLRSRAAAILTTDLDPSAEIFRDVKALYDTRSRIVHGAFYQRRPPGLRLLA